MTRGTALTSGLLAALLGAAALPADADEVLLRGGGHVSGVIVERTERAVVVETGPGRVTLQNSRIERIVSSRSPLETWRERAAALQPRDARGWAALARFAEDAGLTTQAREAWQRVLEADPGNVDAHRGLGHVLYQGAWLDEDEAYRARGYVRAEGRWMSPSEHDALVRERIEQSEAERARAEDAARLREAEARAREAEARAREAESGGSVDGGIPIWWGGYGGSGVGRGDHGRHRPDGHQPDGSAPVGTSSSRPGAYRPIEHHPVDIPPGGRVQPPASSGSETSQDQQRQRQRMN